MSVVHRIEQAISSGVRRVEDGPAHYEYKRRLGAAEYSLESVLIVADRWWPVLKVRCFCRFSDLLHLAYYRIWFSRIAPRVPWLKRPLWRLWMRSRL